MSKSWALVWLSIAAMVVVACITVLTTNHTIALGSAADWAAAGGTMFAAVVALYIAGHEQRRADRADKQADIRLLKAFLLVMVNGSGSLAKTHEHIRADKANAADIASTLLMSDHYKIVSGSLNEFRVSDLPSTRSIDLLMAARSRWGIDIQRLEEISRNPPIIAKLIDALSIQRMDEIVEMLADEIVQLGGGIDVFDDTAVQLAMQAALRRTRR